MRWPSSSACEGTAWDGTPCVTPRPGPAGFAATRPVGFLSWRRQLVAGFRLIRVFICRLCGLASRKALGRVAVGSISGGVSSPAYKV